MLCRVLDTFITKDGHRIRQGTEYEWTGEGNLPRYLAPIDAPPAPEAPPPGQVKMGRRTKTRHDEVLP